jgi:hypothetical protein
MLPILKTYAATPAIAVDPPVSNVTIGDTFNININVTNIANFTGWQLNLYFLKAVLNCTAAVEGPFLKTGGGTFYNKTITNNFNVTHGKLLAYSALLGMTSVNGSGTILTVTFKAVGGGNTPLHMDGIKLLDEKIPPKPIPYTAVDGTVQVVSGVGHDVAITDVIPIKSVVGKGYGCNITVVTENHGGYAETYNITLHANETEIATKLATVQVSGVATVDFTWNTTGFAYGNYTISAYAWPVPSETNTGDNTYEDGWVLVSCVGDVNGDKKTSISDIVLVIGKFGTTPSSPEWNPNMDIDGNDKVTIGDIVITINNFGNIWT